MKDKFERNTHYSFHLRFKHYRIILKAPIVGVLENFQLCAAAENNKEFRHLLNYMYKYTSRSMKPIYC